MDSPTKIVDGSLIFISQTVFSTYFCNNNSLKLNNILVAPIDNPIRVCFDDNSVVIKDKASNDTLITRGMIKNDLYYFELQDLPSVNLAEKPL